MTDYATDYLAARTALEAFYSAASLGDWGKAIAEAKIAQAAAARCGQYALRQERDQGGQR